MNVSIGRVTVRPGDWLVGDDDGVVLVPADEVEQVTARAEEITQRELTCWENVLGGQSFFDQLSQDGTTLGERMLRGA